jgi:prefoldin beta subunit
MNGDLQQKIVEFEQSRSQLLGVSNQRQQLQMQSQMLKLTLDELAKTDQKQVYKAVGNILILSDTDKVKEEIKERKESTDLRVKTLQKQEESLVNKLNSLKSEIEAAQKAVGGKAAEAKEKTGG